MVLFPLLALFAIVHAQFPPPVTNQTVHTSPGTNITIRYKEPGICETTPGVKSVHPPGNLTLVCWLR
jgi:hypothetical protein